MFYLENENHCLYRIIEIERILLRKRSKYQLIEVAETKPFGRALFLDGVIQLAQLDEHIYHETLVHVPLSFHPSPEKVLILGGGDGMAVRELLKDQRVKKITLVDIDADVVEVANTLLTDMNKQSLRNEKVNVIIDDARKFVKNSKEKFDIVFMDLVDPFEGKAEFLYSRDQLLSYKNVLAEGGIIATHGEALDPKTPLAYYLKYTFEEVFKHTWIFNAFVPSFGTMWGFVMGSDEPKEFLGLKTAGKNKFLNTDSDVLARFSLLVKDRPPKKKFVPYLMKSKIFDEENFYKTLI